ncbi:PD-(D/E)XK nuclease family protein [Chloroflexota bacterium]
MSTKLFLEGYGNGALKRLGDLVSQAKGDDLISPITIVVPTMYAGLSARRSLGKQGGLINVRFMVIPRLAEYLGAPALAMQGKSPLTPIMKLAGVRHFAEEMAKIEPLGSIASHPPIHDYLLNTFDEFARLSEEQLSQLEGKNPLLRQVVKWYRAYRELTQPYYDREELAFSAADTCIKSDAESVLKDLGFIIFYLPASFSPGELALVSSLGVKGCCSVILGITGEEETDTETYRLGSHLESVLGTAEVGVPSADSYNAGHIVIVPDAYEEVRWALRNIARYAEKGIPFHRMALLYRNTNPYSELVKSQLQLAEIPAAGPDPVPLRDSTAGKLLLYVIEVFQSDYARESVMRWIAEAPVNTGKDEPLSANKTALWEEISGKAGIISGIRQWSERLERFCIGIKEELESKEISEEDEDAPIAGRDETRLLAAIQLKVFLEKLSLSPPPVDTGLWKDYSKWASQMMQQYASPESWPEAQISSYERVIAVLDEIGRLDAIEPGGTTLAKFRQTLDDCLSASSGRLGSTGDGVFVAPLGAALGMEFEIVHILGMAEGAFPPKLYDDAIIPDQYRAEFGDSSPLPLRSQIQVKERRLFRAALASGSTRILSYPRSGVAGQRLGYPSTWLVREAEILHRKCENPKSVTYAPVNSANLERMATEPWISVIHSAYDSVLSLGGLPPSDVYDYDMNSLAKWHVSGYSIDRHFLMAGNTTGHRALKAERSARDISFTPWDGNVTSLFGKSLRLGVPGESAHSPTRLELWAKCPFRYYLQHVLELSVLERPEEILTISPLDRGSLVHKILEKFIRSLEEKKSLPKHGEPWAADHRILVLEIAEEEFAKAEARGITGVPLLWDVAKSEIRDDLSLFLKKDSEMRAEIITQPIAIEWRFGFGEKSPYPPVMLDLDEGHRISFRGVIDRVDADASGTKLFIIDYKTGKSYSYRDMKDNPLGTGTHLQLPVYALAIRSRFGQGCEIKAAYWFISAKSGFETREITLSESLESDFRDMVKLIVSGIDGGLFPANPGKGGEGYNNCTYCDYRRICPSDVDIVWERKSQNPELAEYVDMTRGVKTGEIE